MPLHRTMTLSGFLQMMRMVTMIEHSHSYNMTFRRILQLLLLLTLVSISNSQNDEPFSQYESVNLDRCFDALRDADLNGDGKIDADEHLTFLQQFGSSEYWNAIQTRPLELRAKFNAVACMCIQRGSPPTCCHGNDASIDIHGILSNENDEKELDYLETVCILTQRAIDEVERQRIEETDDTTTSVWLRTAFQVTLLMGNTQSEDELLQDLGTAMNNVVEKVIEEETSSQRRGLEGVEYLPTRLEWQPAECNITMPPQDTCYNVDATTYVVGPRNMVDQASLEQALVDAIEDGQLQEELDTVNPDSSLRILDSVPEPAAPTVASAPPPTPPPQEDKSREGEDPGHDWSTGAITGLVLAAAGLVGLAAGLSWKRKRSQKKHKLEQEQMQASLQGSKINMGLMDDGLEHDLDDLEKGNGGGGILLGNSNHDRNVSYTKMDQVGMEPYEDDSLPMPPQASNNNERDIVVLPFVSRSGRQSKRDPSIGDMQASNNEHMDSLNASNQFAMNKHASSGSISAKTPVSYNSAMGLQEDYNDRDGDSMSSSSSSSSSDEDDSTFSEGDTDYSDDDSSSAASSEYDQNGIMKASAYEARLAQARDSMIARSIEENAVAKDAPAPHPVVSEESISNAGIAVGGAAFYAATRETEDEEPKPVREALPEEGAVVDSYSQPSEAQKQLPKMEQESSISTTEVAGTGTVQAVRSRDVEQTVDTDTGASAPTQAPTSAPENSTGVPYSAEGVPSTGLVAGITAGAVGAIALGGAAIYAATRSKDDDDDKDEESLSNTQEKVETAPQMQLEQAELERSAVVPSAGMVVVGANSFASINDPVAVGEESHLQLEGDESLIEDSGTISSGGLAGAEDPSSVGEESQPIDDPVAVGEESAMMENESSTGMSAYSSGDIFVASGTSGEVPRESEMTAAGDSALESASGYTPESQSSFSQYESSAMLRPPPRPFSPSDEGLSTSDAVGAGTAAAAAAVGAGAVAALAAQSSRDDDGSSDFRSESSSESSDESSSDDSSDDSSDESSDAYSDSQTETNADSETHVVGVTSSQRAAAEFDRARPPPTGSENYAAATAMAVGATEATGAVYDFSESGYSTSSYDQSSNLDEPESVYDASATGEESRTSGLVKVEEEPEVASLEEESPTERSKDLESVEDLNDRGDEPPSVGGKADVAAQVEDPSTKSFKSMETTENSNDGDDKPPSKPGRVGRLVAAWNAVSIGSRRSVQEETNNEPSGMEKTASGGESAVTAAAVVGAGALAGVALASVASRDSQSEEEEKEEKAENVETSSEGIDGYVKVPASSLLGSTASIDVKSDSDDESNDSSSYANSDESDDSSSYADSSDESDDSSAGEVTNMATAGKVTGGISTADETRSSLSTNAGMTSVSNQSIGSDAAVVQGRSVVSNATESSVAGSTVSENTPSIDSSSEEESPAATVEQDASLRVETTESSTQPTLEDSELPAKSIETVPTDNTVVKEAPSSVEEGASTGVVVGAVPGVSAYAVGKAPSLFDDEQEVAPTNAPTTLNSQPDTVESSHATAPTTQCNEGSSTGAVIAGAVAGGAAILAGATALALGRKASSSEDEDEASSVNSGTKHTMTSATFENSANVNETQVTDAARSTVASSGESGALESTNNTVSAVVMGGAIAAGVASRNSADQDSRTGDYSQPSNSTDDERTTDDESSEGESADVVTDVAVTGGRSLSRSTLATSMAGTTSVSRSTLETSTSTLQESYQGNEGSGSTSTFFAKERDSSIVRSESSDVGVGAAISASKAVGSSTIEFDESSSSSSSSYDSDSPDEYSSSSSGESSTDDISYSRVTEESRKAASASGMINEESTSDAARPVEDSLVNISRTDELERNTINASDVETENVETDAAALSESATTTLAESATLTESGDTFLAMEEAAFATNLDDVAVTKTRFAPKPDETAAYQEQANEGISVTKGEAASAVTTGVIGAAVALATETTNDEDGEDSESQTSEYTTSSSEESSSSDSSSYYASESESESSASSDDRSDTGESHAGEPNDATEIDTSKDIATIESAPAVAAIASIEMNDNVDASDRRDQLRKVQSEGLVSRRKDAGPAPSGPGARAQLLRARSDAMLQGNKRDETLQSLLTSWDNEYDLTTGEEETTTSSEESLLVLYANAGLPPIAESDSGGSSQSLSNSALSENAISEALKSGPLPEDRITASMQHGSSSLLNFDYSLRTVQEEESGEVSGINSDSAGTISSAERAAALDQSFEKEVLHNLDSISEKMEAAGRSAASIALDNTEAKDTRVGSSGLMSLESSGKSISDQRHDDDDVDDGSSYTSESSSEYTSSSNDSSEDSGSSSSSDSEGSSSSDSSSDSSSGASSTTSGSPVAASPDSSKGFSEVGEFRLSKKRLPTLIEQTESSSPSTAGTGVQGDHRAESTTWAAISEANKTNSSHEGGEDAAEWAIKRSMEALKAAEERANDLASSSSGSSSSYTSSSDVSFSSDYASSSDED